MSEPGGPAASPAGGGLAHLDAAGNARMIDVGAKLVTSREAVAVGRVMVGPHVVAALRDGSLPKGDALAVARIAGIMGAKRTPDLVPLCHPVALTGIDLTVTVGDDAVHLRAATRTNDRTGVEMEALTAVCVAALAVVDMVKGLDPAAVVTGVTVVRKSGGRSGTYLREQVP